MSGNDYHFIEQTSSVELNTTGTKLIYVKKPWLIHSTKIKVLLALFIALFQTPSNESDT